MSDIRKPAENAAGPMMMQGPRGVGRQWRQGLRRWLRGEAGTEESAVPADAASSVSAPIGKLDAANLRRVRHLKAALEVGHAVLQMRDAAAIGTKVAGLIADCFGFDFAAVFLVSETGDEANLLDATGEVGRQMRENTRILRVGGESLVGSAIRTRQACGVHDTLAEPPHPDDPLLPGMRSEIALPLRLGDRTAGALDVQSREAGAFDSEAIEALQAAADQVSIAIDNARSIGASSRVLEEMKAVQRQYVVGSWKHASSAENFEYSVGDDDPALAGHQADFPLSLRDETIGEIRLSGDADWTADQRSLVESVAAQASLALEHARLVETSQAMAQREHGLADITAKVWAAPTFDSILRTAVGELGQALDAEEATIEIRLEPNHD
jgi:GAF domain-containing protein